MRSQPEDPYEQIVCELSVKVHAIGQLLDELFDRKEELERRIAKIEAAPLFNRELDTLTLQDAKNMLDGVNSQINARSRQLRKIQRKRRELLRFDPEYCCPISVEPTSTEVIPLFGDEACVIEVPVPPQESFKPIDPIGLQWAWPIEIVESDPDLAWNNWP